MNCELLSIDKVILLIKQMICFY